MFERYIGIEYSGAEGPDDEIPGIQVYVAGSQVGETCNCDLVDSPYWSRKTLAQWVLKELSEGPLTLLGIDHAFSFPREFLNAKGWNSWDSLLEQFDALCNARHLPVSQVRRNVAPENISHTLRLTEKWTSSAKSVFNFVGAGVAHSTFAGLPWLYDYRQELKRKVLFWPFDGWRVPPRTSVIAEVYPSMTRHRYHLPDVTSADCQDAFAVAAWMEDHDKRGSLSRYFEPPLTDAEREQGELEGWILGVM